MRLSSKDIATAVNGAQISGQPDFVVTGVSTDSRTIKEGDLFFALHGANHDGHHYIEEVLKKGASAVVVDRTINLPPANIVLVKDTLRALGDLARFWRRCFSIPVVAVTGSNGKTTTKDLIAAILSARFKVLKTEGNFNNLIGLPHTIFRLREEEKTEIMVLEMGMNHPGEIDRLSEIAEPQVGVITNVARAHMEGLGSLSKVARAKGELLLRLPRNGVAILNRDDAHYSLLKKLALKGGSRRKIKTFGKNASSYAQLLTFSSDPLKGTRLRAKVGKKMGSFAIPLMGRHNAINTLVALAVGDSLGMSPAQMRKGLSDFCPASKRMEIISLPQGIDIINDCYNANPDSVLASLDFLKEISARRRHVAILGEMLETGREASRYHREVGRYVLKSGVNLLFAIGEHANDMIKGAREKKGLCPKCCFAFDSVEAALPSIQMKLRPRDFVLIKGSRGMRMERITEEIQRLGINQMGQTGDI